MANLIDEIATYLGSNGAGTLGTNLFEGYLPSTPDAAIAVLNTGGTQPDIYLPTKEPTFQIMIRSTDYETGLTKLNLVRDLLHQQNSVRLVANGIFFFFIYAIAEGGHIGRDDAGLDLFSINFRARTR